MSLLNVAVIGTGALGKQHARLYAELASRQRIRFCGVHDTNPLAANDIANQYRVTVFESLEVLWQACDVASIVTPTTTHFEIAKQGLNLGKHVLIEKPMTETAAEAGELVELAQHKNCVLQVGHVERFNPVFRYLTDAASNPRFIETHRLSPFPGRSTDVGVVLDLMIHDLDIVLAFVKSPVTKLDAVGIPVLSQSPDIANARIGFENGCTANLTVSRISPERMRKIRVFSAQPHPCYISLDYQAQEGYVYRLAEDAAPESSLFKKLLMAKDTSIVSQFGGRKIVREPVPITKEEPLRLELESFIDCVQAKRQPVVSGASAKQALDLALEINRLIDDSK